MHRSIRRLCIPHFVALVLLTTTARADDGVLEINQTCAVQTGCFPGDSAGFPVTIDGESGRSHRLTSDLVLPDADTTGIRILADSVSIDLAGFELRGPVVCNGKPLACTPSTAGGFGGGISSNGNAGVSVRNGSIRGTGGLAVSVGEQAEVTNLRVRSNLGAGIFAFHGSTVSDNAVHHNAGAGILVSVGSTVSGNASYRNSSDGIFGGEGTTISGNSVYDNGGDGIEAQTGSAILGNAVRLNSGFGLNLLSRSGYRENVISDNSSGTVNGSSLVDLGDNACNGSPVCP